MYQDFSILLTNGLWLLPKVLLQYTQVKILLQYLQG